MRNVNRSENVRRTIIPSCCVGIASDPWLAIRGTSTKMSILQSSIAGYRRESFPLQ